jgi:hypothetical protein
MMLPLAIGGDCSVDSPKFLGTKNVKELALEDTKTIPKKRLPCTLYHVIHSTSIHTDSPTVLARRMVQLHYPIPSHERLSYMQYPSPQAHK